MSLSDFSQNFASGTPVMTSVRLWVSQLYVSMWDKKMWDKMSLCLSCSCTYWLDGDEMLVFVVFFLFLSNITIKRPCPQMKFARNVYALHSI